MQSVVVAYSLAMAMLIPASGWVADRFGARRVYFLAIVFLWQARCSVRCRTARPSLVAARVLQGWGRAAARGAAGGVAHLPARSS